jgi:hypothetical protein
MCDVRVAEFVGNIGHRQGVFLKQMHRHVVADLVQKLGERGRSARQLTLQRALANARFLCRKLDGG